MKRSEKMLVGIALIAGGLAVLLTVGMDAWNALNSTNASIESLKTEINSLETQKTALAASVAQLEKNTQAPLDVHIRKFNDGNREEMIKAILDQVVSVVSGTGNLFVGIVPAENREGGAPLPPSPAETSGDEEGEG